MKRLGLFTGRIYEEGCDVNNIEECCVLVSDEQIVDKIFVEKKRQEHCCGCHGCPSSRRGE